MDIYENIVVGNFLFGLGAALALRQIGKPTRSTCVNLLQQTPLDKSFGDVVFKHPGIFRILEFKREANDSIKEKTKHWMLLESFKSGAFTKRSAKELEAISRRVHWYVETSNQDASNNDSTVLKVRILPYLDFPPSLEGIATTPPTYTDLAVFVEAIATEAANHLVGEVEMDDHEGYINLLCRCQGSVSSGALILHISENGSLQYTSVSDIREVLVIRSDRSLSRERDIHFKHEIKREIGLQQDRGMRLGLSR